MADHRQAGPLGTPTNTPTVDSGTLVRSESSAPGPICTIGGGAGPAQDSWTWGVWDLAKWKLLPSRWGGGKEVLFRYKDAWVMAHKATILTLSDSYGMPAYLLAGVAWNEVGGDPDWIDSLAYPIRSFDHLADPYLEPLTITQKPELTSFGDVSIQLRRAAQTAGLDFKSMTSGQQKELFACLESEEGNLQIVARHLWQLKNIDFRKLATLTDEEVRVIGARYNRGPDLSLEDIRKNTAYGDAIVRRKSRLLALLAP